jgi:DNA mismatch repair ATPase MutL
MLQQYILGAVQVASQNHKSKYPVALVKIDTDSTLIDFNRELDKSKVFLEHEVSQMESMPLHLHENTSTPSVTYKLNLS